MKRKLQVFVSSTYEDLKEERQSAVQAILTSGHLPAGMELFSAGDESQKDTIKKWIQESDAYLLILGGRYGSIDASTGKSYTHWEYDYAGEINKPRFAVFVSDEALQEKVKREGTSVIEMANQPLYQEFRKEVLTKLCKPYNDHRDIQLAIFHKMSEYSERGDLVGWVHGSEVPNVTEIINENTRLVNENTRLRQEVTKLRVQLEDINKQKVVTKSFDGLTFEELEEILLNIKLELPNGAFKEHMGEEYSILLLFISFKNRFATGITNELGMNPAEKFQFFTLAPQLMTFNLVEKVKVAGVKYEKIQTSKQGFEFLKLYELKELKSKESTKLEYRVKSETKKANKKHTTTEQSDSDSPKIKKKATPRKANGAL